MTRPVVIPAEPPAPSPVKLTEGSGMRQLAHDIRFGIRTLVTRPGFAVVAVLSLALGIGVNTTIFSLVNAVLLRPLPVEDSNRLVSLYTSDFSGPLYGSSSYPDYLDFRDRNNALTGIAGFSISPFNVSYEGRTERSVGQIVTENYFEVLGINAARGRLLTSADDAVMGASPVAVVSYGFWQRRFGADREIVGREITVNGQPFTVVGVAPASFTGIVRGLAADLWVPVAMHEQLTGRSRLAERDSRWLMLVGRLDDAASLEEAQAALTTIAGQLHQAYPRQWSNVRDEARQVTAGWADDAQMLVERSTAIGFLGLLMVVVGCVLLLACANVANLLLARAASRRREIGIRLSLGAGRGRLVRQLLTESVLLSLLAGALGLALARWATSLIMHFQPPTPMPVRLDLGLDGRVLSFTLAVSLLTALIFGVLPALKATRLDLTSSLKQSQLEAVDFGPRWFGLRNLLVAGQVGMSLFLLIGAGLFVRSLAGASSIDVGFKREGMVLLSVDLAHGDYDETRGMSFFRQLLERIESTPGVQAVSLAETVPLGMIQQRTRVEPEGYTPAQSEDMELNFNVVGPAYFETLDVRLVRGRTITARDDEGGRPVVVVNEALARRYWPDADPIGKRLRRGGRSLEVVGVVRDGKYRSLSEESIPYFYLPLFQTYRPAMSLHVRTSVAPAAMFGTLRREMQALDRNLPVYDIKTMDEHLGISLLPARLAATLLGSFGILALVLAVTGVYGVMSYSVSRRTHEVGIRMALGASAGTVVLLVLRYALTVIAGGLAFGLAAAFALTRFAQSFLYGTSATDLGTFAAVSLLLAGVALTASLIPACRAASLNPVAALRHE